MENQQDSRELAHSAQCGDRQAFEQLVSASQSRIRLLVASRLRARVALHVDEDDVLQESLLRAFDSIGNFEWQGEGSFLRWLGAIIDHVILKLTRQRARERKVPLEVDVAADEISPSRALRRDERFERLQRAIQKLEPEHREVIRLTRFEGLKFAAAAERMGRSPDAVKQLLYRALKKLRSSFGDTESIHLAGGDLWAAEDRDGG